MLEQLILQNYTAGRVRENTSWERHSLNIPSTFWDKKPEAEVMQLSEVASVISYFITLTSSQRGWRALAQGASINPAVQGIQPRCLLCCAMKARLQTHMHVRQSSAQFHLNTSLYLLTQFYLSSELKFSRIQKGSESHSAGRSGAGVLQTRSAWTTNLTGKWSLRGKPSWQAGPSQIAAKRCWTEADE